MSVVINLFPTVVDWFLMSAAPADIASLVIDVFSTLNVASCSLVLFCCQVICCCYCPYCYSIHHCLSLSLLLWFLLLMCLLLLSNCLTFVNWFPLLVAAATIVSIFRNLFPAIDTGSCLLFYFCAALSSIIINPFSTVVDSFLLCLAAVLPVAFSSILTIDCCSQTTFENLDKYLFAAFIFLLLCHPSLSIHFPLLSICFHCLLLLFFLLLFHLLSLLTAVLKVLLRIILERWRLSWRHFVFLRKMKCKIPLLGPILVTCGIVMASINTTSQSIVTSNPSCLGPTLIITPLSVVLQCYGQ